MFNVLEETVLVADPAVGAIAPVHDPSIFLLNGTFYLFSSDPVNAKQGTYLTIRCSKDKRDWKICGEAFTAIPAWIRSEVPEAQVLWAPDISYFNGVFHLYYAASTAGSQNSVIGLATNTTLDAADPNYRWIDRGKVLASHAGDDFNAIDPNLSVDSDQRVWLTYGSYWSGIKQREIDGATGLLLESNPVRNDLATRTGTADGAIEGASIVHHGVFYYLFLSADHCCTEELSEVNYKQIVGRSSSPNGPFLDTRGRDLMKGGGSILLQGDKRWLGPGGGTAYVDTSSGESLLVFHALDSANGGSPTLWVKTLGWQSDWPSLN